MCRIDKIVYRRKRSSRNKQLNTQTKIFDLKPSLTTSDSPWWLGLRPGAVCCVYISQ